MLEVTKIVGESMDLRTGEAVSKSLVVSNGSDEVMVPVSEVTMARVVRLWAGPDNLSGDPGKPRPEPPASPRSDPVRPVSTFQDELDAEEFGEESEGPGDEYNDPVCGSGSI